MTVARVLRTVLASLHLLVGIGLGMAFSHPHAFAAGAPTAAVARTVDCAHSAGGATVGHATKKMPCAPAGKLADHRHCPNCPAGGSCFDTPPGTTAAAPVPPVAHSAGAATVAATTDPTGRNPPPDPRPPRALA